jgi:2-polyprenyl-3-methyl-5-hydroxy-6-metoxy-1,4-benzoquinol methylase
MRLDALRRHWNELGRRDARWAVLTTKEKAQNRWSGDEFYETGRQDVGAVMAHIEALGLSSKRQRALDFGCGVGRLTRWLPLYCAEVVGVDIAESMIERARRDAPDPRCQYLLNTSTDLAILGDRSFDFILTKLVLQHMPPRYIRRYLRELLGRLSLGGVFVFQLPDPSREPPPAGGGIKMYLPMALIIVYRKIRRALTFPRMESHGLRRDEVLTLVEAAGCAVADVRSDASHGTDRDGFQYVVVRPGATSTQNNLYTTPATPRSARPESAPLSPRLQRTSISPRTDSLPFKA